jgi:D-alanyl-D-alanine carboxypeptidase/D-alanyl-D-alanine-endopeptidase (penicillin-binding protein 4)
MDYVKSSGSYRRRSRRSRGRKRRLTASLLAAALVALVVWLASRQHARPPAPVPLGPAAVPKVTPPPPPWTPAQRARLHNALRSAFAPALAGADRWSLAVLAADGRTIYADRADRTIVPASVQKLIVAATALDVLGPAFRYHTILASDAGMTAQGTIDGNLWLVGSGDPSFTSRDLRAGVSALTMAGLRRVGGRVAVDATAMQGPGFNPDWDSDDRGEDYAAPTSAVSIDDDTVEFDVTGTQPGQAASVRVVPRSAPVHLSGEIVTTGTSADPDVGIAPGAEPGSYTVDGSIGAGAVGQYWVALRSVPQYVAGMLDRMLRGRGVGIAAPPAAARAPLDSIVLWDHRSAPLRALEAHMLFVSDNHYAEQLLRTVGGEETGRADDAAGIATERRFLSERGVPTPGLHLVDGSGLSPDDRVAAITLARILSDAELRGGNESLYLLLPQGGRQGTLAYYDFTTALGRVRAKSGHITGVSSLAGYVNTMHHGRVVFAFSINGSPGDPDSAIVRAVDRLVTF